MSPGRQVRFWLIGFGVFAFLIWLLSGMLLPFAAAMAIAYFLDPVVDRCAVLGLPRWLSSALVLLFFTVILVAGLILILPVVQAQILQFIDVLPGYAKLISERILPLLERLVRKLSEADVENLRAAAGNYAGELVTWLARVIKGILSSGFALFDVFSILFITPVVAFYVLRDWDLLVARVDAWLPRQYAETIREQARLVDRTLAGYIRGQATVCFTLGLFYAVMLSLAGLNFGLMVGFLAGLITFIPYVGSLVGFVSGVGIALGQFDQMWQVAVIGIIFLIGQTLEGYVLTPKLVGENVGLHPVWVMFALLAGASLAGFVGILIALPVAAVIGVLIRFALKRYLESPFFRGESTSGMAGTSESGR
ncbi:MAG: AI-2E family transporter [Azospirillum sp.]|nr:AI-2E family transporter [Azospirillum sp.]